LEILIIGIEIRPKMPKRRLGILIIKMGDNNNPTANPANVKSMADFKTEFTL
jgi:hypothetical protein